MTDLSDRMKHSPEDEDEVHDVVNFVDPARNVVTPIAQWEPHVALAITDGLQNVVRAAHANTFATTPGENGITLAQTFEEGDVYMSSPPFDGFFADRYLMDFYNVRERGICSRMHLHTGLRFVRMMTGPGTVIRVSSLSPFTMNATPGVTPFIPEAFSDDLPDTPEGFQRERYNLVLPENSWMDMQVPRGVSHQFNAIGPHAVIDSVHPEESIETFREKMPGYKMMAQTIFLADELPDSSTCSDVPGSSGD